MAKVPFIQKKHFLLRVFLMMQLGGVWKKYETEEIV